MGSSLIYLKHMWKIIYWIIWIWQLPQNLLGLIASLRIRKKMKIGPAGFKYFLTPGIWLPVIVLGEYIFVKEPGLCRYGYGRSILSLILGPLFLLLVSLPGLIIVLSGNEIWYMCFYANRWSMKLGGLFDRKL